MMFDDDYKDRVCNECTFSVMYNNEECDLHETVIYPEQEACESFDPLFDHHTK